MAHHKFKGMIMKRYWKGTTGVAESFMPFIKAQPLSEMELAKVLCDAEGDYYWEEVLRAKDEPGLSDLYKIYRKQS